MDWRDAENVLGRTEGEISEQWRRHREAGEAPFRAGASDMCLNLLPAEAVTLDISAVRALLRRRYGEAVDRALSPQWTDPGQPASDAPDQVRGPVFGNTDTSWLTATNMVGVNVRTVGTFIGVVSYALTLSRAHDAIHLLPVWEPGVVGSLYGMSSWKINGEFFSPDLAALEPHLDTPERQLKATVNLLHVMGKAVGMDVIPHTDRYSEIVLAHPQFFEWLRREDTTIVDHRADLHEEVQERILNYLDTVGAAVSGEPLTTRERRDLFSPAFDETERDEILFGPATDRTLRGERRAELSRHLYRYGFEPVPATMAPPYRGLTVDRETAHIDADGHVWREYRITEPQSMSRVFGPLTRYKLYGRRDDNRDWAIDFSRPREDVWRYVQERYALLQRTYGFDFMRGDMSHVQMRPDGVPAEISHRYDLLGSVAAAVRRDNRVTSFGYFAETFIAPPGVMAYGDELEHLDASGADVTLGDLQSRRVESPEFFQQLRWYRDIAATHRVVPSFTVMTADKDDPRFDEFYLRGNEARYFTGLFLPDMPSYTALNFECRDPHYSAAPNEWYTKLYVFHETDGPKATDGPFRFGRNGYLFYRISRIRLFAEETLPRVRAATVRWLSPPDATAGRSCTAWALEMGADTDAVDRSSGGRGVSVCVVNYGTDAVSPLHLPLNALGDTARSGGAAELIFSTEESRDAGPFGTVDIAGRRLLLPGLHAGEAVFLSIPTS